MIAPTEKIIDSIESLLTVGNSAYGIPAVLPTSGGFLVYRGDAAVTAPPPMAIISQIGPSKERHNQTSGIWEIPMAVRLIFDRNGTIGQTEAQIDAFIKTISDDVEAALTMRLLIDPLVPATGQSSPEQRLSNTQVYVWDLTGVEVEQDSEMDGDPTCEIRFTCVCAHKQEVIV